MTAPKFKVVEIVRRERAVALRMPFRFGVVTLQEAPQAFVRARIRLTDGTESWGQAAELMVPKWFDKSPDLSNEDNFDQLRSALKLYCDAILVNGERTAFDHFASLYQPHLDAGHTAGLNPLAAGYGPALIDRAVFDALCRAHDVGMAEALKSNLAGIEPQTLLPAFDGFDFNGFLASLEPLKSLHVRHTVGLIDPLTAADVSAGAAVGDGLPETLEDVIERYGHTYFKIKVGGNISEDVERLAAIAAILDQIPHPYRVTLDGNEQYDDVDGVLALLEAMGGQAQLTRFRGAILFVEQPIRRAAALDRDVGKLAEIRPVIIDESDGDLAAFELARSRGYAGVSSKNCKGFYKSLINTARCRMWSDEDGREFFMSAEDLTCQAGVAVQQDLALVAVLGIPHVERNGHHYVNGMAGASDEEQAAFLTAYPDLYTKVGGRTSLKISAGKVSIGSLLGAGFGGSVEPDWANMAEMP